MSHIRRVEPGIWLIESEAEGFDVRACLILGKETALLWDTLFSGASLEGIGELIQGRVLTVVYSHGDWDHVWGTGGLAEEPETILAHEACLPRFSAELPQLLEEKRNEDPDTYGDVRLLPPTRTIRKPLSLPLESDLSLELHPLPGHTPDTLVGFVPRWNVLLAGDAVETPLPFLNPGSPLVEWAEGLERWADILEEHAPIRPPLVIPSHGPLGGPELLVRNAEYLRALQRCEHPTLPSSLPSFYRETHASNLRIAGRK